MNKRIFSLIIAASLLVSVTACTMPQSIFPDSLNKNTDDSSGGTYADPYTFVFKVGEDGYEFSLPVKYSALSARGWEMIGAEEDAEDADEAEDADAAKKEQKDKDKAKDKDKDKDAEDEESVVYTLETKVESEEYTDYVPFTYEGCEVELKFYNDDVKSNALKSCLVVGLRINSESKGAEDFILSENTHIKCLYEDVVGTYGRPSYEKKINKSTGELTSINDVEFVASDSDITKNRQRVIDYALTNHSFMEFELSDYSGDAEVLAITMENNAEVEEEYDPSKDRKRAPDQLDLYNAPNLLGKDFSEFAFKYESNLYTLPIPVRELVDDGWEFARGGNIKVARGCTADGVVLKKGNLAVSVLVHNYDVEKNQKPINCYAVSLCACVTGPNVDIMMPKAITLGSEENALLEVWELPTINYDEDEEDAKNKDEKKEDAEDDEETASSNSNVTFVQIATEYSAEQKEINKRNKNKDKKKQVEIEELADDSELDFTNAVIEKMLYEDYTVYSYIMPDDVPTVEIPVSISDVKDVNVDMLGNHRKRIDIYISNSSHKVVRIYMQNCPEFVVDEAKIWEEYLASMEENNENNG